MINIVSDNYVFKYQIRSLLYDGRLDSKIRNAPIMEEDPKDFNEEYGPVYVSDHFLDLKEALGIFILHDIPDQPHGDNITIFKWGDLSREDFFSTLRKYLTQMDSYRSSTKAYRGYKSENDTLKRILAETKGSLRRAQAGQKQALEHIIPIWGYETASYVQSSFMVSGDVLFVREAGRKIMGFIGDVTSHGLEKGLYSSYLYGLAWSYIQTSSLNSLTSEAFARFMIDNAAGFYCDSGDGQYAYTALFFEIGEDYINLTNCGHQCYPIIIKKNKKPELYVVETSGAIDMQSNDTNINTKTYGHFDPGDGILFYTDGLTEMMNGGVASIEKEYSANRLLKVVSANTASGIWEPQSLLDSIKTDADAYSYKEDPPLFVDSAEDIRSINDDVTLCCIKRKEIEETYPKNVNKSDNQEY